MIDEAVVGGEQGIEDGRLPVIRELDQARVRLADIAGQALVGHFTGPEPLEGEHRELRRHRDAGMEGKDGAAQWVSVTNCAVLNQGSGSDIVTDVSGNQFVPKTPEVYGYDLDGSLTSDGRWNYTGDLAREIWALLAVMEVNDDSCDSADWAGCALTHDPLVSFAPSLHYDYTMRFDAAAGRLTIVGTHGRFPAFDVVVGGKTYVNYVLTGIDDTPAALYFPRMDVLATGTIQKYPCCSK